ncbi:MAG: hypothetical protein C4530_09990 [Desulfobacteraceae bacterium]|nr:MAG: hypothetical protein C4530_09990 [Desulfobacteraceae bacterium]
MIEVEIPEKNVVVEFPDGMSREEMQAAIEKKFFGKEAPPKKLPRWEERAGAAKDLGKNLVGGAEALMHLGSGGVMWPAQKAMGVLSGITREPADEITAAIEKNRNIPFVQRIIDKDSYPALKEGDLDVTHKMAWADVGGKYLAFPTVEMVDGKLTDLESAGIDPVKHAIENKNFIEFPTPEEADRFSKDYKRYWETNKPPYDPKTMQFTPGFMGGASAPRYRLRFDTEKARKAEEALNQFVYQPYTEEGKKAVEGAIGPVLNLMTTPSRMAREELDRMGFPMLGYLIEIGGDLVSFKLAHAGAGAGAKALRTKAPWERPVTAAEPLDATRTKSEVVTRTAGERAATPQRPLDRLARMEETLRAERYPEPQEAYEQGRSTLRAGELEETFKDTIPEDRLKRDDWVKDGNIEVTDFTRKALVDFNLKKKQPAEPDEVQTLTLTGGPPGSGKTTAKDAAGADRVLDASADVVKEQADYLELAPQFHETSSAIAKEIADQGVEKGYHVHFESLLNNFPYLKKLIDRQLSRGGKVNIGYTHVDPVTSLVRSRARMEQADPGKRREVPAQAIADTHNKGIPTFLKLLEEYGKDPRVNFDLFDNSIDFEKPVHVFEKSGVEHRVLSSELFDKIRRTEYHKVETSKGDYRYERTKPETESVFEGKDAEIRSRIDASIDWNRNRQSRAERRGNPGAVGESGNQTNGRPEAARSERSPGSVDQRLGEPDRLPVSPPEEFAGFLEARRAENQVYSAGKEVRRPMFEGDIKVPRKPTYPTTLKDKLAEIGDRATPAAEARLKREGWLLPEESLTEIVRTRPAGRLSRGQLNRAGRIQPRERLSAPETLAGFIQSVGKIDPESFLARGGNANEFGPFERKGIFARKGEGMEISGFEALAREEGWLPPDTDFVELVRQKGAAVLKQGRIDSEGNLLKKRARLTPEEERIRSEIEWEPEEPPEEVIAAEQQRLVENLPPERRQAVDAAIDEVGSFFDEMSRLESGKEAPSSEATPAETAKPRSTPGTLQQILSDINTLMGEKGAIGNIGDLTPEQRAAYANLKLNYQVIVKNAERAGKTVRQYLQDLKYDPAVVSLLVQKSREQLPKFAGSVNLEKQELTDDLKRFEADLLNDRPKRVQTWDETGELANEIMRDTKAAARLFYEVKKGKKMPNAAEMDAMRKLNVNALSELKDIASTTDMAEFNNRFIQYKENIARVVSDTSSEAGRLLNIHKREVSLQRMANALSKLEKGLNERQLKELKELNLDDPIDVKRFTDRLPDPKISDYFLEYWYNAILSGPPTHLVNITTNTGWLAFQVPHRLTTALVDIPYAKLTGKERSRYVNEIVPMLAGYRVGFGGGAKAAWNVMRDKKLTEFESKWSMEMAGSQGAFSRSPHKSLRVIGRFIDPPTRALRAMDVWANQMAYDAAARAIARRHANKAGLKRGSARAAFEKDFLENKQDLYHEEAMAQARYSTFTDLPDPATQAIMQIRNVPVVGVVARVTTMPFVGTISNLLKRGLEMTPGVGLVKEAVSRGMGRGSIAPEVIAKQIEGAILAYLVMQKVAAGEITGPPPKNPNELEAWHRLGKLPWAGKIGDNWYQYRRAEPFNTVAAMTYTAYDQLVNAKDDATREEIFMNLALGLKENVIDGSYFEGLQAVFDRYGKRKGMIPRFAASWFPYSSFFRSINRAYEVVTEGEAKPREGNEWLKAFSQVIPGLSGTMPAKLDVWGEEAVIPGGILRQWLPYKWRTETADPLEKELERLDMYPARPQETIEYRDKKYEIPEDLYRPYAISLGHTLKSKLTEMITMEDYAGLSDDYKLKRLDRVSARIERVEKTRLISEMRKRQIIKGL